MFRWKGHKSVSPLALSELARASNAAFDFSKCRGEIKKWTKHESRLAFYYNTLWCDGLQGVPKMPILIVKNAHGLCNTLKSTMRRKGPTLDFTYLVTKHRKIFKILGSNANSFKNGRDNKRHYKINMIWTLGTHLNYTGVRDFVIISITLSFIFRIKGLVIWIAT